MPSSLKKTALLAVQCVSLIAAATLYADPPASQPVVKWSEPKGKPIVTLHAKGVQIYTLVVGANGKLAWKLKAPEAELTDDAGAAAGRHFKGPTWRAADGSEVAGTKLCERPSPNANSIPELQVSATGHTGQGKFGAVQMIERLNTKGGVAPAVPDDGKAGDEVKVPYTADYAFFAAPATP